MVLEEGLEVPRQAQHLHLVVGVEAQVEDLLSPYDSGDAYRAPF